MSNKKSMGSNPLNNTGLKEDDLTFIPDRRKSQKKRSSMQKTTQISHGQKRNGSSQVNGEFKKKRKPEKKIASYSLEVSLLHRIRKVAHEQDRYYSSIVAEALEEFIQQHYSNK